jgi:hypothetical protein
MSGPSLYPKLKRSKSGYRKDSPDKNEESLVVPDNKISMKEEDGSPLEKGKIKGTGMQTGTSIVMEPGKNYEFTGDNEVLETPLTNVSPSKAKKILKDGTVHGKKLTEKQRRYFGALSNK